MDIDNMLLLAAAIVERANLDIGLVTCYDYKDRSSRGGLPRTCVGTGIDDEHAARVCARKFLDRIYEIRNSGADHVEIAMEIMRWRLSQSN
jgi:hypothetical protein